MTNRNIARLAIVGQGVGVACAINGLNKLYAEGLGHQSVLLGASWLFVGVVVGVGLVITYMLFRARAGQTKTQQQIAVETLAKLDRTRRRRG